MMKNFIYAAFIVGSFITSSIIYAANADIMAVDTPVAPHTEAEQIEEFLKKLEDRRAAVEELCSLSRSKKKDIKSFLAGDEFLQTIAQATGQSKYELATPEVFLVRAQFVISLELRGNATISGPRRGALKNTLFPYKIVLADTIWYYDKKLRILQRENGLIPKDLQGLKVLRKPSAVNHSLQSVYNQLWRDADATLGGTAGGLITEVVEGKEQRHRKKS